MNRKLFEKICPMNSTVKYVVFRQDLKVELGGGFRCFLFSPLFGEDSHFD